MKFPKLIHVYEESGSDTSYLAVSMNGVVGIDEHGTPVAIYQLVDVGKVEIKKAFVKPARKTRKR